MLGQPGAPILPPVGWSRTEKARLLDAIHAAAVEALKIPDEDRTQILTEHPAEAFEIPPGKGDRFTLVDVTMFAGRSLEAKRRLYRAVVRSLGRLGIPSSDVLIILHEVPLENWGIRGGTPATDVDLGFESVSDRRLRRPTSAGKPLGARSP
jgi:phenylpyruvate tautomerase PptA (4-oxalocrotonate tautomerase family)